MCGRRLVRIFGGIVISMPGTLAKACLVCKTGTGEQVRAGLCNGHFGYNLFVTLLPFPVFTGIVALIYFGVPFPRRRRIGQPSCPPSVGWAVERAAAGAEVSSGSRTPDPWKDNPCKME